MLDCLNGYLLLAARLSNASFDDIQRGTLSSTFNFGPDLESNRTVEELVIEVLKHWSGTFKYDRSMDSMKYHESNWLYLNTDKARRVLGWMPFLNFEKTIQKTMEWYSAYYRQTNDIKEITRNQISEFKQNAMDSFNTHKI